MRKGANSYEVTGITRKPPRGDPRKRPGAGLPAPQPPPPPPSINKTIGKKGGGKRKPSANFLAASNDWREHLAKYRKENPGKALKDQMREASKTYKKINRGSAVSKTRKVVSKTRNVVSKPKKVTKRRANTRKRRKSSKKGSFFGF